MRITRTALVTVALALAVTTATARSTAAQDAAQIKHGQEVYAAQKCQMCHAIAGKGSKSNPLDGVGGKLSAADLHEWLVNPDAQAAKKGEKPVMKMKSFKSLSADDLDSLVAYLQTLK